MRLPRVLIGTVIGAAFGYIFLGFHGGDIAGAVLGGICGTLVDLGVVKAW